MAQVNLGNVIGPQGPKGDPNVLTIGTVVNGNPGENAEASITGDSPNQILNLKLPRGATGLTPELTIGNVMTLDPGEQAKAIIRGTAEEPIIDLELPKGDQGIQGEQGIQGIQGIQGPPVPVDDYINDASENAVKGRVVKEYIDSILGDINTILAEVVDGNVVEEEETTEEA